MSVKESPQVWGNWDDSGPFCVLAEGRSIDEAAAMVEEANQAAEFGDRAVPMGEPQPRLMTVHDCEYDQIGKCTDPQCRHGHEERVFVFELVDAAECPPDPEPSRTITCLDEDGIECEYLFVDSFEHNGKTYAVLADPPVCCDEDEFLMRLDLDENGDEVFAPLDDDEREAAEAEWARLCEDGEEGLL